MDKYILYAGGVVLHQYRSNGRLTDEGKEILRKYTELAGKGLRDKYDDTEKLFIAYLLTGNASEAIKMVDEEVVDSNQVSVSDKLMLAEYYVIVSDYQGASRILKDVSKRLSVLEPDHKKRYYSVKTILSGEEVNSMVNIIAVDMNVHPNEARKRIFSYVKSLQDARKKYSGL